MIAPSVRWYPSVVSTPNAPHVIAIMRHPLTSTGLNGVLLPRNVFVTTGLAQRLAAARTPAQTRNEFALALRGV
jgi:hypothetical protein